jgi:hypothetical protein
VRRSIEHVIPRQGPTLPLVSTLAPSQFLQATVEYDVREAEFMPPHAEARTHGVGPQRKRPTLSPAPGESSRRPRRDRGPNWNLQEMLALVDANREEYLEELDTMDARDLMDPDVTKWSRISDRVMAAGHSPCVRDHAMCKSKWHLLIPDYRRISDYHARTGTNKELY